MEGMLGDRLRERMPLLILLLMLISLGMGLCKEIPILILVMEEPPVCLIYEAFIWLLNKFKGLPMQGLLTYLIREAI